jgi:thymidylate synthase
MHQIIARNVSEALFVGRQRLLNEGLEVDSRNGPTLEMPGPMTTTYTHPRERVLFYPQRDANPFFHLFESLWMLAGRDDVEWVAKYVARMKDFSTDGSTLNGAYGYRWRNWFGYDQLKRAAERLIHFDNDRRTVVAMWDGHDKGDLSYTNHEKDIPCNTHIYFKVRDGKLNMTVCCRSNDMIWGAYGANAVHFSILHEYMAALVGVDVGVYTQFSDSFHAYTDVLAKLDGIEAQYDPYLTLGTDGLHYTPMPLVTDLNAFNIDLQRFIEGDTLQGDLRLHATVGLTDPFFRKVVKPMHRAYWQYRKGNGVNTEVRQEYLESALRIASEIEALDWRKACVEWLQRRLDALPRLQA